MAGLQELTRVVLDSQRARKSLPFWKLAGRRNIHLGRGPKCHLSRVLNFLGE